VSATIGRAEQRRVEFGSGQGKSSYVEEGLGFDPNMAAATRAAK